MDFKDIVDITELEEFQNLPPEMQEEYLQEMIQGAFEEMEEERKRYLKHRRKMTLAEILFVTYTAEELKQMCRESGYRGYSALKKRELAQYIAQRRLDEDYLKRFLLYLDDENLSLIDELIENDNYTYLGLSDEFYMPLLNEGYIAVDYNDNVELATDFNEVYEKIRKGTFGEEREKAEWSAAVLEWIEDMYASAPESMYYELFRLKYDLTDEEIRDAYYSIPEDMRVCVFKDNRIITRGALPEDLYLDIENTQDDIPYYIPAGPDEILNLYRDYFLSKELKYINLMNWFIEYQYFDEEEAKEAACEIWNKLNLTGTIAEVEAILDEYDVTYDSEEELNSFMEVLAEVFVNTRLLILRGNKIIEVEPDILEEMSEMNMFGYDAFGQFEEPEEESNVISFEEWKKNMN